MKFIALSNVRAAYQSVALPLLGRVASSELARPHRPPLAAQQKQIQYQMLSRSHLVKLRLNDSRNDNRRASNQSLNLNIPPRPPLEMRRN